MPSVSSLTATDLQAASNLRHRGYTWAQVRDFLAATNADVVGVSYQSVRGAVIRFEQYGATPSRRRRRSMASVTQVHDGLTYGVEVEFRRPNTAGYALDESVIVQALRDAGIEAYAEDYNHSTRPHWKLIYDGSSDKELVSPILSGEDGVAQVRKVMEVLRTLGCRVTRSEGMHVHIGANHLTPVQIAMVAETYTVNSNLFDSVLARTRRPGGSGYRWCHHLGGRELREIRNSAVLDSRVHRPDRYRSVNLTAFATHGTIEFRQHQGTLNGTKATAWVALLTALVTWVTNEDACEWTPTTWASFEEMATAINLDARTTRYFTRRAAALTSEAV